MPKSLTELRSSRRVWTVRAAALAGLGAILVLVLAFGLPSGRAEASDGGGLTGTSGDTIWSLAWWDGTPLGPGPDIPGPGGGVPECVWIDLGPAVGAVDSALGESGLPTEFFDQAADGGHPGIWGVNEWAERLVARGTGDDHFDLVSCPNPAQVPPSGGYVESALPEANPPGVGRRWIWLFWDTVPDVPGPSLPPVNEAGYAQAQLPVPVVETSPSSLDGMRAVTVVNFPTWLWIDAGIWHLFVARAEVHGLVATIWATPLDVVWRADWRFRSPAEDPEGGVSYAPEHLDQTCPGPGTPYDPNLPAAAQTSDCSFVFEQSTFGTRQPLSASIEWDVHWAVSNRAGVVGGEGALGVVASTGVRSLRVLQVESIVSQN